MAKRIVHYLNQFYAGIGGEDMADVTPSTHAKVMGPGMALKAALGADVEIVGTVVCGDNYVNSNSEVAIAEILEMIKAYEPDGVIAGPAFNAGRYGVACGMVCKAVMDELKIPVVTGMYGENPGCDMYKKDFEIVVTKNSAADMRRAGPIMAKIMLKKLNGEPVLGPAEEGYHERGIRVNYIAEKRGSARAVDMLLKILKGEEYTTEYPMPVVDRVEPAAPLDTLKGKKIALVTSGGVVPQGNPDHIESCNASKCGRYCIEGFDTALAKDWLSVHGGYDRQYINEDPNLCLGLDALRNLEREGFFGELYPYFYSTVGNGTATDSAKRFAIEYVPKLIEDGVDAVVLTST